MISLFPKLNFNVVENQGSQKIWLKIIKTLRQETPLPSRNPLHRVPQSRLLRVLPNLPQFPLQEVFINRR
jgi:hypothetical protein